MGRTGIQKSLEFVDLIAISLISSYTVLGWDALGYKRVSEIRPVFLTVIIALMADRERELAFKIQQVDCRPAI